MKGRVDGRGRSLLDILVSNEVAGACSSVTAWIDTAFDGHLVFSAELIEWLRLEALAKTEAVLADGTVAIFDTFLCYIDWFGFRLPVQVMANEGRYPLLGTGLLEQRDLHVNYKSRALTLD